MDIITTFEALSAFCERAAGQEYVTIDTEFLRERRYYSKLCLLQMALPSGEAVIVDPINTGLDLAPFFGLLSNSGLTKVFHAARQDLEIFWQLGQVIPDPLFDTQIAAMVCGFGEQVAYETLVRRIAGKSLDKSSRFTDWSHRPLSEKQMIYALADVTHLREIYVKLRDTIAKKERESWVREEIGVLTNPETYEMSPERAWERIRIKTSSSKTLAVLRELAAFREREAQNRDTPRARILKDDVLVELASTLPTSPKDLEKSRMLPRDMAKGWIGDGILDAVRAGLECPPENRPSLPQRRGRNNGYEAVADLLRVLLKACAEHAGVAAKLIATSAELDDLIDGDAFDHHVMHGWRYEVFGRHAQDLMQGKISLSASGSKVLIIPFAGSD